MKKPDLNEPIFDTLEISDPTTRERTPEALTADDETTPEAETDSEFQDSEGAFIAELKRELEQERDRRLRLMAEYDNFRRRTQAEFRAIIEQAGERILTKLLPLMDDFERLAQQEKEQLTVDNLWSGVELIERKFGKLLADEGAAPIMAVGRPFNVQEHEALTEMPDADNPPGIVLAELERGWLLKGKVIRHAKVIVSRKPVECESEDING
ncbi:MAG: nucleotide exchange factor GrpE [Calditrichota bacterium]